MTSMALALLLTSLLAACGGGTTTATTPQAGATSAPVGTTTGATSAASQPGIASPGATTVTSTGGDPRGAAPAKRGGGGTLHMLFWQAPTILNIHQTHGTKDTAAARVVSEPLASISINAATPDVPVLAKEIPSAANGELAADGTSVTWKLKDGVKWSDGTPLTSADVQATWQYIVNPANGATDIATYQNITSVDTPDPTTVKITFNAPTATWFLPFTSAGGVLQKAQLAQCMSPTSCPINTNPIGTGPFKVQSFSPGDNVQYALNENYREANAPFFDAVDWKGGGDATTAAKAVQTGQADFGWNLQVDPSTLKQLTDAGYKLDLPPGAGVEQILVNFADPRTMVDGELSSPKSKNPFFSDPQVREAISYLVDRDNIAKGLYGSSGTPTCNYLPNVPPQTVSKNTKCGFDVAKANQLLDAAGWKKGGDGIREKNGVKMVMTIRSTINPVREKEEQVLKQSFQQAGITLDIKNVDASVYFGQPDNPDAAARFQTDLEILSNTPVVPDAGAYFLGQTTEKIAQQSNGWKQPNYNRFSDPQYDMLANQLQKELDPQKRIQLQIECNDYLVNQHVFIPIVDRNAVNAHRADLINTNPTPFDFDSWNIAYWQIKK